MKNPTTTEIHTDTQWTSARRALLREEKALTKQRDTLAATARALPWRAVGKLYTFISADGPLGLDDLFGGYDQLIIYHFMFAADWDEGCKSCAYVMDHLVPSVVHIQNRGVAFAAVSLAPIDKLQTFARQMGWPIMWVSSGGCDFNLDFHVTPPKKEPFIYNGAVTKTVHEMPGLSVFAKDEKGQVFHTYSTYGRGLESFIGAYRLLDIVPRGRGEQGLTFPMDWVRLHDGYEK
ncbi:MAG: DUF899 domain-containing protein [Pseudomonadota bacterium]